MRPHCVYQNIISRADAQVCPYNHEDSVEMIGHNNVGIGIEYAEFIC